MGLSHDVHHLQWHAAMKRLPRSGVPTSSGTACPVSPRYAHHTSGPAAVGAWSNDLRSRGIDGHRITGGEACRMSSADLEDLVPRAGRAPTI